MILDQYLYDYDFHRAMYDVIFFTNYLVAATVLRFIYYLQIPKLRPNEFN